jgi:hypothetical protein
VTAAVAIAFLLWLPPLMQRRSHRPLPSGRIGRLVRTAMGAGASGVVETISLVRRRDPLVYIGTIGY